MKKLLTLILLFAYAAPSFAAIAAVGGATVQCVSASTCPVTYTATNGNIVVACLSTSNTVTAVTAKDNNNVSMTNGSQFLSAAPNTAVAYYTATGSPTSFSFSWTTARASSVIVEEYSGVTSVTGSPSGGTNSGSSTAVDLQPVANEINDFAVSCHSRNASTQLTANVGNRRQEIHAASPSLALVDATSTGATATDTATTAGSTGLWSASGLILRPTVSATPNPGPRVQ